MGRRKKYFNDEQLKTASSKKSKIFYEENKEHLVSKAKENYWMRKIRLLKELGDEVTLYKAIEKARNTGVFIDIEDL